MLLSNWSSVIVHLQILLSLNSASFELRITLKSMSYVVYVDISNIIGIIAFGTIIVPCLFGRSLHNIFASIGI